jgi:hypothetical protein
VLPITVTTGTHTTGERGKEPKSKQTQPKPNPKPKTEMNIFSFFLACSFLNLNLSFHKRRAQLLVLERDGGRGVLLQPRRLTTAELVRRRLQEERDDRGVFADRAGPPPRILDCARASERVRPGHGRWRVDGFNRGFRVGQTRPSARWPSASTMAGCAVRVLDTKTVIC